MQRLLNLLLGCILYVSCLPGAALADKGSIAFISPGGEQGFWGTVADVMREASRQLDVPLEILHSDRNRLKMLEHAQDIVKRDVTPDYVIIVNELQQGPQLLKILNQADIPVFFLLNTVSHSQLSDLSDELEREPVVIGSIVTENFQAGYDMLNNLVLHVQKDNPVKEVAVLAILGDQLTPAALEREAGMRKAIQELENVVLKRAISVLWDPVVTKKRVKTAMSLIEFDVIWAANDALALASNQAVASTCEDDRCLTLPVAGLNWSPAGLDAVKRGQMISSHGGHFFAGAYAIASLYNHMKGREITPTVTLRLHAIDSSNVERYERDLSAQNWVQFDFNALAREIDGDKDYFDPRALFEVH